MSYTGIPVMIYSNPGLGKSKTVEYLAKIKKVPYFVRSANKLTDVELMGIPYTSDVEVSEENGVKKFVKELNYSLPKYIKELQKNPNGVLFFDEITTAPISIQTMLLTIIQDKNFNEFKIPDSTFCVAAGNYTGMTGTTQMSPALMNRFCMFHLQPDLDFFIDGSESNWTNYEYAVVETDPEVIMKKEIQYIRIRNKFLKANRALFYNMPEEFIDKTDFQYGTYRSWTNVVHALAVLDGNDDDFIRAVVEGLVGVEAANLFIPFLKSNKVFSMDLTTFVGKESTFRLPDPDAHDQVHYIMKNVMYLLTQDNMKYLPLWKQVINVLHNKGGKYGNYPGYDNTIFAYLDAGMNIVTNLQDNKNLDIKKIKEIITSLNTDIDDWNILHTHSVRAKIS
jgi:hypothetical protein